MEISLIVALDQANGIGKNNKLLCYLPADLKRFKALTTGHSIVMGRKTFESLPNGPLPNRKNIVLSRDANFQHDGILVVNSVPEILDLCKTDEKVFVIGGGEIYSLFIDLCQTMHITKIHHTFDADTFFPTIQADKWEITDMQEIIADEKNKYNFSFIDYKRKPN